jgi:hypothetical protein
MTIEEEEEIELTEEELEEIELQKKKDKKEKMFHENSLIEQISQFFNQKNYSDVTFLVGDIENGDELKPLYAHRSIISARW